MTQKEHRRLDCWIAENVMRLERVNSIAAVEGEKFYVHTTDGCFVNVKGQTNRVQYFQPTTDPADAMDVLKKCMVHCSTIHTTIDLQYGDGIKKFIVRGLDYYKTSADFNPNEEAETLELAIAKFSLALFSKKL